MMVYAALMAALTAVGAYVAVPIGPVPIVLQNLFVLLAGVLLGSRWGVASMAVYVLAGAVGLPVFASGAGGLGVLVGPTGGYLVGFIAAAYIVGWIVEKKGDHGWGNAAAMTIGALVIYLPGVIWLKIVTGLNWQAALAAGVLPFLIGDALKIAVAAAIAPRLRQIVKKT